MPNNSELYHFIHTSPEIETVADLLNQQSSPAFLYQQYPERFLAIVGEDNLTNRQRIENSYLLPEDKIFIGKAWSKLRLLPGTLLYLEYEKVNQPSFLTEGIEVVSSDEPAFKATELAKLEADKGYISVNKPVKGKLIKGGYEEILPEVTVWIWCRALSDNNDSKELKGEFFDLTPFIENVSTSMTKNGGNFQIKLPPLMCEQDNKKKWKLINRSVDQYVNNNGASLQGTGYVAHSTMFTPGENGEPVRTQMLFHNIISPNDLVFIRFETLEMEKEQRYEDAQEFIISKKNIAGRIYDMIGLVDNNTQSVNPLSNDVSINITGRDLMKLFIDDGCYFYALENSQGILKFAGQSTQKNSLMSRIFSDGALNFIGLYQFTSIEYILKFIIQQLSNIKIIPNDLLDSYEDRRNKTFTDFGSQGIDNDKRTKLKADAITYVKSLRERNNLKFTDESRELEKLDEIFFKMSRFLNKIRIDSNRVQNEFNKTQSWKSFVFEGEKIDDNTLPYYFSENLLGETVDTDIWKFINVVDNYIDAGVPQKRFKEQLAPGIWQIIKLVIDKSVGNRRLADSSFSTANGALLNFIRTACQDPLVEFYADTYGDTYNLIVRRPPYDQKGLISLIEGKLSTEDGIPDVPPAIVNIRQEDVLRENLQYDDQGVYSWYHFFPRNALIGDAQNYALSYIGALFFEEYAEVWGSRPFQQSNTYIPYVPLKSSKDLGLDEMQAVEDLKYVVEANQYNPFTRKGSITVNRDRRLKIGNIFRYESTGEIGFITGVRHDFQISESSIDGTTTINVERMMIEQLIYGQYMNTESDKPVFISYYNIINTRLVFNKVPVTETNVRTVKKKSTIEKEQKEGLPKVNTKTQGVVQNNKVIQKGNEGMGYLDTLNRYPENKKLFIDFINGINKLGYKVILTERAVNRTYEQQAALKFENPNNASAGNSRHERGAAIDITVVNFNNPGDVCSKNTSEAKWRATGVPALANSLGLRWGGKNNDGTFGSYVDRVHFEIANFKPTLDNLEENEEYEDITETTTRQVIDRNGIFQNFKVNKEVFNFFLKKRQMDEELRTVTSRLVYDSGGALLDDVQVISTKKK